MRCLKATNQTKCSNKEANESQTLYKNLYLNDRCRYQYVS